ncbi:MAG: TlpA disulfide reductase family protein [Pseudomonadota bacterium]
MAEKQSGETPQKGPISTAAKTAMLFGIALAVGAAIAVGVYAFQSLKVHQQVAGGGGAMEAATSTCSVDEAMKTRLSAAAIGEVAAFTALDRGFDVSEFGFLKADGSETSMADWSGRTVLLNLWATWCAPCRAEMPALQKLQQTLGSDGFEVVPISLDLGSMDKPKAFYDEVGLTDLGLYHDAKMASLTTLKKAGLAFGLPATLLISTEGCVLGTLNGPAEWAGQDAQNLVKTALTKPQG